MTHLLHTLGTTSFFPSLLAQAEYQSSSGSSGGGIFAAIFGLIWLAVMVALIASLWVVFTKAGQPGWAAIIPIYNIIVLLQIVGKPIWWIVLFLIPIVSLIAVILVMMDLAKSFGKSAGFGVGLILLSFVFLPLLAFGDARYIGPQG